MSQRVLITGGNRGIGRAITQAFVDAGAKVAISSRSGDPVESVKTFAADFTHLDQAERLFEQAHAHLGGIDVLINNAAGWFRSPLDDLDAASLEPLFRINVIAPIRLMQLAAPQMAPGSSIINISSVSGGTASATSTPNCTTKAALDMVTRIAALEWKDRGIRINTIAPGAIDEFISADEVAALALYLTSPAASGIHGTIIRCDGGQIT